MHKSNYSFLYNPRQQPGRMGFNLELTAEFARFAKSLPLNQRSLDERAQQTIREIIQLEPRSPSLAFDGGLIWKIELPGAHAPGLCLDEQWETRNYAEYTPHNIDSANQTAALLAIMTHYLRIVENSIDRTQK